MRPEYYALITAVCWGIGNYYVPRALQAGRLSPVTGALISTSVGLLLFGAISFRQWGTIPAAGPRNLLLLALCGGLVASTVGMLSFYVALNSGGISRIMALSYTAPLFTMVFSLLLGYEAFSTGRLIGILMTVGGITILLLA